MSRDPRPHSRGNGKNLAALPRDCSLYLSFMVQLKPQKVNSPITFSCKNGCAVYCCGLISSEVDQLAAKVTLYSWAESFRQRTGTAVKWGWNGKLEINFYGVGFGGYGCNVCRRVWRYNDSCDRIIL